VKAWARSVIKRSSRRLGYDIVAHHALPPDFSDEDRSIIDAVRPYTMTTPERLVALMAATRYIIARAIPGDIVECGVWRGGSMMATAQVLRSLGVSNRGLYLFDTFTGMPTPGPEDVDFKGTPATDVFRKEWCYAPLDSVQRAVHSVGYDPVRIRFVPGQVERTIPEHAPDRIACSASTRTGTSPLVTSWSTSFPACRRVACSSSTTTGTGGVPARRSTSTWQHRASTCSFTASTWGAESR
jgi:hypothetical protein